MAYIGYNPSQLAVAPFAVKSFTGDGSTTTFTLDQSVPGANEANVEVFVENVQQSPIDAYTIGGALNNSLIFSEAPVSGAVIYVIHKGESTYNLQPSTGSVTAATLDPVLRNFTVDNFTGDGSTTSFTLTDTPYSANSILVTVDGIVQTASTNYTVSGTTLSFGSSAPDNGAIITVVHLGFSSGNKTVIDGGITPVKLSTGGLYWNTSGQVSIGSTSPRAVNNTIRALTVEGMTAGTTGISIIRNGADGNSPYLNFVKTRGTVLGGNDAVVNGDQLGLIFFNGADGTTSTTSIGAVAARIEGIVDGTVSTGIVPGRLVFRTADSAGALAERMRIDSAGNLLINGTTVATSNGGLTITNTSSGAMTAPLGLRSAGTANGSGVWITHRGVTAAGAESDYNYIGFVATDTTARTGHITFQTASGGTLAEKMRIDSTGLLTLPYGQIKFPATQNASSDANTLDDYEEGTWTPGIAFGGNSVGVTYNATYNRGWYTKIGNHVTCVMACEVSNKGSSTGDMTLTGFPFAAASKGDASSSHAVSTNNIASTMPISAYGTNFSSTLVLAKQVSGGTQVYVNNSDVGTACSILGVITYLI